MKNRWLRWTLPPGISILFHALLIVGLATIGMRIRASAPSRATVPLAELGLEAPPERTDQTEKPRDQPPLQGQTIPDASPTPSVPNPLDAQAASLGALNYTRPVMDPVAIEALERSSAQSARPQSASPPTVRFAGVQTRAARKIVYVVDGSGATANSFAYLQTQLLRSIDRLSPTQRFQIVLFRSFDGHTVSYAPFKNHRLSRATPGNKRLASEWLATINARGRSNPLDGLRAALSLKPELVLLITRSIQRTEMGWAQGQRAILGELNTLNPLDPISGKRPSVIKTIQLLDEDPTGIMRAIATFHGDGTDDYRVVTYDDLVKPEAPDEQRTRSLGASSEQRISSASELMGTLAQSGTAFSVLYTYADQEQRRQALDSARRIRSLVLPLSQGDGRAAILDAQATLLIKSADPGSLVDAQVRKIVDAFDAVAYSEPNTDAQRVLTVSSALALLNDRDGAQRRVGELIESGDDLGLDQSTRAQALVALVAMGGHPSGLDSLIEHPPFVTPSGAIDAVWGVLVREAMTKARLRDGEPNPWSPMIELRRGALGNEPIRNYIDTRIALILASSGAPKPDAKLPTQVLMALSNTMSHSIDQRQRAMDLLREIATRSDDPAQMPDALWRLGVLGTAINTTESRARAAQALSDLAERYPDDPRAPDAISAAIHATPARDEQRLIDRLRLAINQFPDHPEIDLWRLALAEMLSDFAVLDVLDPVTPNTREGVLAGELYEKTVLGMLDRYTDEQIRRGLGIRMREAAKRFAIPGAEMWTKRAALSEAALDPKSALASVDQLIAQAAHESKPTDELELMRAQLLNRLGQTHTAFTALSDLSRRIDATENHTSTYWQAWSLMLETIVASGSESDQADALRHIARLRLIDPNLGGSPWKQRITSAQQTLHSSP